MIFKSKPIENKLIQDAYDEGIETFSDFFNVKPVGFKPDVFILDNRADIDIVKGKKTENWVVGWTTGQSLFVLDYDKFDTESKHNKSESAYQNLIKHELCHIFTRTSSRNAILPMWLNEGISIYLSGQLGMNKKPDKFSGFIESTLNNHKAAYVEGGYVVELLLNLFGREKFIDLLRGYSEEKFKDIYGFDLTYENINSLYQSQEISSNEAVEKFKEIIDKPFKIQVKHNGNIELKFSEYLLSIERSWDVWDTNKDYHSQDFVSLKDEETIESFVGKTSLSGVDITRNSIFSFFFENGKEIDVTGYSPDSGFYFKLFSFKPKESTLALTSTFKYILLSDNLK